MRIFIPAQTLAAQWGIERGQLQLARGLRGRDHEIGLGYVAPGPLLNDYRLFTSSVYRLAGPQLDVRRPWQGWRALRMARTALQRFRPDVVYVHYPKMLAQTVLAARTVSVPVVFHAHMPVSSAGRQESLSVRGVRGLVSVSRYTAEGWGRYVAGDRIAIVHNAVDATMFRPPTSVERHWARGRFGISPDTRVIAYVGRINANKGVDRLIDAVREIGLFVSKWGGGGVEDPGGGCLVNA